MVNKNGETETNYEVRTLDRNITSAEYAALPKNPIYIVLDNLRSAFNVGAIFRLCDIMRVSGLYLCGYTAYPPHIKLDKTSLGTIDYVPWIHFSTTLEALDHLASMGVEIWAAETSEGSICYSKVAAYPPKVAVVFGNEALGVSREVLARCSRVIEIPVYGFKNSLNVASSCAVIGFSLLDKMGIATPYHPSSQ